MWLRGQTLSGDNCRGAFVGVAATAHVSSSRGQSAFPECDCVCVHGYVRVGVRVHTVGVNTTV